MLDSDQRSTLINQYYYRYSFCLYSAKFIFIKYCKKLMNISIPRIVT